MGGPVYDFTHTVELVSIEDTIASIKWIQKFYNTSIADALATFRRMKDGEKIEMVEYDDWPEWLQGLPKAFRHTAVYTEYNPYSSYVHQVPEAFDPPEIGRLADVLKQVMMKKVH